MSPTPKDVTFFETPERLRDWLDANHTTRDELWVGIYKKGSGKPTVVWAQIVDEALCVGWIDRIAKSIDATSYAQRLTPRRKGSNWSAINVANVARLTAEGRMRPAGLAAFEARTDAKTAVYSYERDATSLSDDETSRFQAVPAAWADWEKRPPSYRKAVTAWVTTAKQATTRERRLAQLIEDSAAGREVGPMRRRTAADRSG